MKNWYYIIMAMTFLLLAIINEGAEAAIYLVGSMLAFGIDDLKEKESQ